MKFWKLILLTTILFLGMGVTIFYTSCEKEPCNNVTCFNGGSCGGGICHCPTGYENTQCQSRAVDRFVGTYAGYVVCDQDNFQAPAVIDTVSIYRDSTSTATINYAWVVWKNIKPKILRGYVYFNESVYTLVIPNVTAPNDLKIYTLTLQNYGNSSNNKLVLASYEKLITTTPPDTTLIQCTFTGFKH